MLKPLPFVFPYALAFWIVYWWAFGSEFGLVWRAQRPARASGSPDARSYYVLVIGMWIAIGLAFAIAFTVPGLRVPEAANLPLFIAGLVAMVAGALLRRHCKRMLTTSFTGDVRVRPDQEIVARGAYAWLRHPGYTAGILMYLGIGLALGSWASTLLIVVAAFVTYEYRIRVEERALLATIGEPYRQFVQHRKRLIPFIY